MQSREKHMIVKLCDKMQVNWLEICIKTRGISANMYSA
jgi:hypothetical protein